MTLSGKAAIAGIGATEFSKKSGRSELQLSVEAVRAALADAGEPEFWNAIILADVLLGRALTSGEVAKPECQKAVIEAYLRPWKRGGSPLKFASVLEQIDFVAEVLTGDRPAASKETRAALVTALRFIAGRLRAATSAH